MVINGNTAGTVSFSGKNIFWQGNSISARYSDGQTPCGYYLSNTVSAQLSSGAKILLMQDYSKDGWRIDDNIADWPTYIKPRIRGGDIVVNFEIYNYLKLNTVASTWAQYLTYINLIKAAGAKFVFCTAIGNHNLAVRADYDTDRLTFNQMVRDNAGTYGYAVCDLGAVTHLATQADADDTTYYGDPTHPKKAGLDLMLTPLYNAITSFL